jgi:hypothetical protein
MNILDQITTRVFNEDGFQKAEINNKLFIDTEINWATRMEKAQKLLGEINEAAGASITSRIKEIAASNNGFHSMPSLKKVV